MELTGPTLRNVADPGSERSLDNTARGAIARRPGGGAVGELPEGRQRRAKGQTMASAPIIAGRRSTFARCFEG
jgi:hypothetical protein